MTEYIEPMYQLPQRAESLHIWEDLLQQWKVAMQQVWKAFESIGNAVILVVKRIGNVVERAFKDIGSNLPRKRRHYRVSYHPRRINHKRALIAQRKMNRQCRNTEQSFVSPGKPNLCQYQHLAISTQIAWNNMSSGVSISPMGSVVK